MSRREIARPKRHMPRADTTPQSFALGGYMVPVEEVPRYMPLTQSSDMGAHAVSGACDYNNGLI